MNNYILMNDLKKYTLTLMMILIQKKYIEIMKILNKYQNYIEQ